MSDRKVMGFVFASLIGLGLATEAKAQTTPQTPPKVMPTPVAPPKVMPTPVAPPKSAPQMPSKTMPAAQH